MRTGVSVVTVQSVIQCLVIVCVPQAGTVSAVIKVNKRIKLIPIQRQPAVTAYV